VGDALTGLGLGLASVYLVAESRECLVCKFVSTGQIGGWAGQQLALATACTGCSGCSVGMP
jgi:hypothetical protein